MTFPVLAISESRTFTGIWGCIDESGYRQGSRGAFDAGCWKNLQLVDAAGRLYRVVDARIESTTPGRSWQALIPASRAVTVACDVVDAGESDLVSVRTRVLRMIGSDEEGFAEMRALYHGGDFEGWRAQIAQADTFEALIALFLSPGTGTHDVSVTARQVACRTR